MSNLRFLSTLPAFLLLFQPVFSQASVSLEYEQSKDFWGVLGKIQDGVGDINSANSLLNQTYGKPVGAEISVVYRKDEIELSDVTLREVRLDQVGYAVSSNPILPHLFGWEGLGLTATAGWQFLEVYTGKFFGKRVDAVSTDLIDRKLVDTENVFLFGAGIHYQFKNEIASLPVQLDVFTRHTQFLSSALPSDFRNRWKFEFETFEPAGSVLLIVGQNPVPGFDQKAVIWNYLWQTDAFPDFMSTLGIGAKSPVFSFLSTQATFGFFGGYLGGKLDLSPCDWMKFSLHSFGYETTAAYQASELRQWGADWTVTL